MTPPKKTPRAKAAERFVDSLCMSQWLGEKTQKRLLSLLNKCYRDGWNNGYARANIPYNDAYNDGFAACHRTRTIPTGDNS